MYTNADLSKITDSKCTLVTPEQARTLIPNADGTGPHTGARLYGMSQTYPDQIIAYRTTRDLDLNPPATTAEGTYMLWVSGVTVSDLISSRN